MKVRLLFLFFFSVAVNCSAQEDSTTKAFVREVLPKEYITKEIIIYNNSVEKSFLENMKSILGIDSTNSFYRKNGKQTYAEKLKLTRQEIDTIAAEIKKMEAFTWSDHLLENGRLITRDTIAKIFTKNGGGWDYYHKNYGQNLYSFSKPIFLRNNTLCFFCLDYGCSYLCGSGGFYIYELKNGAWVKVATVMRWAS